MEFKLLDHGYVKLVDSMGTDLSPLEAARMSTDNPTGVDETKDDRLRTRLWGDQHSSPFEMNELVVEVQCPMFVLRQMDRHRTVAVSNHVRHVEGGASEVFYPESVEDYDEFRKFTNRNEFSGRYSTMPDLYYIPPHERIRKKSKTNKQGSGDALDPEVQDMVRHVIDDTTRLCRKAYETIVEHGVASELARLPLPQNQYTKIRLKACLLHWLKFLDLRLRSDVQEETRAYAQTIAWIARGLWPKCWDVFEEFNLYGARLSRRERLALHFWLVDEREDWVDKLTGVGAPLSKREARRLVQKLIGPDDNLMQLLDCVQLVEGETAR